MRRRAYLSALAAVTAGCAARADPATTVELASEPSVGAAPDTAVTVTVVDPEITLPEPARVRVTVRNAGTEPRAYAFDPTHPPVDRVAGEADAGSRRLLLADPDTLRRRLATCWRPTGDPEATAGGAERVELAAGEARSNTLALWDVGPEGTDCFPGGDYRFSTAITPEGAGLSFTLRL